MSKTLSLGRTILFAGIAAALLAVLPAAAGSVPQAQPALTPACQLGIPATFATFASSAPAVAIPAVPQWLAGGGVSSVLQHKFHGFCPCGCSSVPNCNTNADCGGATCSPNISCC
ncbi:MAG TPA: hypothetical protein VGR07_14965 [Thermoanaerobaculia bacterium]|jgi:hypothetical protein|nr:hypothetical protein [Thermoanaerobaculia bacterium]